MRGAVADVLSTEAVGSKSRAVHGERDASLGAPVLSVKRKARQERRDCLVPERRAPPPGLQQALPCMPLYSSHLVFP